MIPSEAIKKIIERYETYVTKELRQETLTVLGREALKGSCMAEVEIVLDQSVLGKGDDVCPTCDSTVRAELVSKCRDCGRVQCPKC